MFAGGFIAIRLGDNFRHLFLITVDVDISGSHFDRSSGGSACPASSGVPLRAMLTAPRQAGSEGQSDQRGWALPRFSSRSPRKTPPRHLGTRAKKNMNVLVVDDQKTAREALQHALTDAGYQTHTAADGRDALQVLDACDCQLVVADWKMPGMNGIDLCHAIRGGEFRGYVYFIMLTSNSQPQHAIEALSAGADDYVAKPFNSAELVLRVNTGRRIIGLETRDLTIFALAKLAESRDPETGAHLERVRSYCRCLAKRLRLVPKFSGIVNDRFVQLIYDTSPLHDIGKVNVPDRVLLKPGKLTPSEFDVMKTHAQRGAETLEAAIAGYPQAAFLQMARDIALTHHEKYDGTGYPYGLAGDQIPLCGRIMAVADVYDALRSKRVYKPAFSHEVAKAIILEGSGKHFDPDVVDAFAACESEFVAIGDRFADDDAASGGEIVGQNMTQQVSNPALPILSNTSASNASGRSMFYG